MVIRKEDWAGIARMKKEELRRCQVCGGEFGPEDLRAKHLQYGDEVEDKYMLIVCQECNHRMHLAEEEEKRRLAVLNSEVLEEIRSLGDGGDTVGRVTVLTRYMHRRAEIISDAIVQAVGDNRTGKRPVIDMLYMHPCMDEDDIISICKDAGTWDGLMYAPIAKRKLEALRKKTKKK